MGQVVRLNLGVLWVLVDLLPVCCFLGCQVDPLDLVCHSALVVLLDRVCLESQVCHLVHSRLGLQRLLADLLDRAVLVDRTQLRMGIAGDRIRPG